MSTAVEGRRWLISGRVQGVFFRASTRRQAERLGLTGSATNLSDGRVEVAARGPAEALERLEAWLHKGPTAARVDSVEGFGVDPSDIVESGFQTD
ncbi:MAG: acylphosphatase [Wenzhouxiangella sp.]|nr:MAG: acylphosphatase [Wenzhouxiangella sp.]